MGLGENKLKSLKSFKKGDLIKAVNHKKYSIAPNCENKIGIVMRRNNSSRWLNYMIYFPRLNSTHSIWIGFLEKIDG